MQMDKETKRQIEEYLSESREKACQCIIGWFIGLSIRGEVASEEDIKYITEDVLGASMENVKFLKRLAKKIDEEN